MKTRVGDPGSNSQPGHRDLTGAATNIGRLLVVSSAFLLLIAAPGLAQENLAGFTVKQCRRIAGPTSLAGKYVNSVSECSAHCTSKPTCEGFELDSQSGFCRLNDKTVGEVDADCNWTLYIRGPGAPGTDDPANVRVLNVEGDVEVLPGGVESRARDLTAGMTIKLTDRIFTGMESSATLEFADNSTVVVEELTDMVVEDFTVEGKVVRTQIWLRGGEIAAQVREADVRGSDFSVRTPTAVAGVRGTAFSVRYVDTPRPTTVYKVSEGVVWVRPASNSLEPLEVPAGSELHVRADTLVERGPMLPFTERADPPADRVTLPPDVPFRQLPSPDDASGADDSGNTPADGPNGRLNVALPADVAGSGWDLRVVGTLTYSEGTRAPRERRTALSWMLGDDGTLHRAGLYGLATCRESGSAEFDGDSFRLRFVGGSRGSSNRYQVEATGKISGSALDDDDGVAVYDVTATVTRWNADGDVTLTGTFQQTNADVPASDYRLERSGMNQVSHRYCGDGRN